MNQRSTYFCLFVLAVLVSGCIGQYDALLHSADADLKYKKALEYFDAHKYTRSKELFESVLLVNRGSSRDDSVQYYLGLSTYNMGLYDEAEVTFKEFTDVFPRSTFTEKARFLRIDCLYKMTYRWELDQLPSRNALAVIQTFLYEYPQSTYVPKCKEISAELDERLERKAYESAKLYYKIEDYKAATTALRSVLRDDPETKYREEVMYYLVASSYHYADKSFHYLQRERFLAVIDEYYNFISEFSESKHVKEVEGMFHKAQKVANLKKNESAEQAPKSEL